MGIKYVNILVIDIVDILTVDNLDVDITMYICSSSYVGMYAVSFLVHMYCLKISHFNVSLHTSSSKDKSGNAE
jgi:hypothetical protein